MPSKFSDGLPYWIRAIYLRFRSLPEPVILGQLTPISGKYRTRNECWDYEKIFGHPVSRGVPEIELPGPGLKLHLCRNPHEPPSMRMRLVTPLIVIFCVFAALRGEAQFTELWQTNLGAILNVNPTNGFLKATSDGGCFVGGGSYRTGTVARFDVDGRLLWCRQYSYSANVMAAVNSKDHLYMSTFLSGGESFVAKLDGNGDVVGTNYGYARLVGVDQSDRVWTTDFQEKIGVLDAVGSSLNTIALPSETWGIWIDLTGNSFYAAHGPSGSFVERFDLVGTSLGSYQYQEPPFADTGLHSFFKIVQAFQGELIAAPALLPVVLAAFDAVGQTRWSRHLEGYITA
jgi:hypothetical protein